MNNKIFEQKKNIPAKTTTIIDCILESVEIGSFLVKTQYSFHCYGLLLPSMGSLNETMWNFSIQHE